MDKLDLKQQFRDLFNPPKQDFAEIAGTELLVIDDNTTLRDFSREVRWNQAYYRLAQGL